MTMRLECDFRHGLAEPTITRGPEGPVLALTHGQASVIVALSEASPNALCLALIASIGRERPTEWAQETLYLVVNARYQECLATSLTTNLSPAELRARLGEPILDRLAETNQGYWCQWPSHRRRAVP